MNMISILLASLMCAGSPLVAQGSAGQQSTAIQSESRYKLGSEAISQIRSNYEEGQYDEFLSEMDESYKEAVEGNQLEGLIELRKEAGTYTIDQDKLIEGFEAIQKQRNNDLLKVVAESKDAVLIEKVQSATADLPSKGQQALLELSSYRTKAPGTGLNADENKLIEIDLEYHYKAIHLDSLVAMGQEIPDRAEKQIALQMEHMGRLMAAAQDFQDQDVKQTVLDAFEIHNQRLAKSYDANDLNSLAKGKVKPQTGEEEKIASIIATAHGKFSDLNRDLLNEQEAVAQN